jgi:hypothetical protein
VSRLRLRRQVGPHADDLVKTAKRTRPLLRVSGFPTSVRQRVAAADATGTGQLQQRLPRLTRHHPNLICQLAVVDAAPSRAARMEQIPFRQARMRPARWTNPIIFEMKSARRGRSGGQNAICDAGGRAVFGLRPWRDRPTSVGTRSTSACVRPKNAQGRKALPRKRRQNASCLAHAGRRARCAWRYVSHSCGNRRAVPLRPFTKRAS